MTLHQAIAEIESRLDEAEKAYGSVVFDEWLIARLSGEHRQIRHYFGPRTRPTDKEFRADLGPLRAEILSGDYSAGDLEFVRTAEGKAFDAFIVAGMGIYLILNNVRKTVQEITANPKWHGAQVPLVQLSEAFRADPLADRGQPESNFS